MDYKILSRICDSETNRFESALKKTIPIMNSIGFSEARGDDSTYVSFTKEIESSAENPGAQYKELLSEKKKVFKEFGSVRGDLKSLWEYVKLNSAITGNPARLVVNCGLQKPKGSSEEVGDSSQTDNQAEEIITKDKIWELYEDGDISVKYPKKTNLRELIKSVKERIQEMWGDEEINFSYEPKDFGVEPSSDGTLHIYIKDSVCNITLNV